MSRKSPPVAEAIATPPVHPLPSSGGAYVVVDGALTIVEIDDEEAAQAAPVQPVEEA